MEWEKMRTHSVFIKNKQNKNPTHKDRWPSKKIEDILRKRKSPWPLSTRRGTRLHCRRARVGNSGETPARDMGQRQRTGREVPSPAAARDVRARRSLRRLVSTRGCRHAHSSHCHSARGQPMWLQRARAWSLNIPPRLTGAPCIPAWEMSVYVFFPSFDWMICPLTVEFKHSLYILGCSFEKMLLMNFFFFFLESNGYISCEIPVYLWE